MANDHNKTRSMLGSVLFLALYLTAFSASAQQVSLSDFQALLAFKGEADPKGFFLRSWNGTRNGACSGSWAGVKCANGQVIALQLPFKGLGGRIAAQIGLLRSLRKLSLHDNFLTGMIPSSIGLLPNLRGLYLFNNRLSGSVPLTIGRSPGLQNVDLSNNFLMGPIPISIGSADTKLYRLNLSYNSLSGSIPGGVYGSPSLTFLALQHNNLSGPISDTWGGDHKGNSSLRVLTLDYNHFTGTIPLSLSNLSSLRVLSLSHNRLSGPIEAAIGDLGSLTLLDFSENNLTGDIPISLSGIANLTSFNVSYNSLSGVVPSVLSKKFSSSSFVGNLQLCGYSSSAPCPSSPSSAPSESASGAEEGADQHRHKRKLNIKDIILILVGSILAILLLLCCVLLCCLIRKRTRGSRARSGATTGGAHKEIVESASAAAAAGSGGDGGKLVLFDGPFVFSADDLLCATAEIMGKNAYGTVYKATLEDGNQVAVKRLREKLAKSPKEFEIEVAALGRIRHPNLLPLRAYYLGPKGEKLLVFDYLSKGSLSSFLHGHGPETIIDWATRMKITMGIARGLRHLHQEENLAHGNLTAGEVYLDEQDDPKISDYGVSRLMTESANTNVMATAASTGYRAPELQKTKKSTTKTDIYSLGVIMLELLTGKAPGEQIEGADLPQWVASTVKEEWTNEVFDVELQREAGVSGDEMLNTLKLALHLVDPSPEARPEVQEVMQQLEEISPSLAVVVAGEEEEEKRMQQE